MKSLSRNSANISVGPTNNKSRNSSSVASQGRPINVSLCVINPQYPANYQSRISSKEPDKKWQLRLNNSNQQKSSFFLSKTLKPSTVDKTLRSQNVNKLIPYPLPTVKPQITPSKPDSDEEFPIFNLKSINITGKEELLKRAKALARLVKDNYVNWNRPNLKTINQLSIDSLGNYRKFYIRSLYVQGTEHQRMKKNVVLSRETRPSSAPNTQMCKFLDQSLRITSDCNSILDDKSLLEFTKRKKRKVSFMYKRVFSRYEGSEHPLLSQSVNY